MDGNKKKPRGCEANRDNYSTMMNNAKALNEKREQELNLLKQLPVQRRIELLEDRIIDLENLFIEICSIYKSLNGSDANIGKTNSQRS